MTSPCGNVHAFADGELDAAEHERFVAHLGACDHCGRELETILTLAALADDARELRSRSAPPERWGGARAWRRRGRYLAQAAVPAMALAAGLLLFALRGKEGDDGTWTDTGDDRGNALLVALAGGTHRQLEGRLAYPGLDRHRRLNNQRAGGASENAAAPPPGLAVEEGLAELEVRGDLHGLGVAHLLLGNLPRARAYLERAPSSTTVLNDRATLALREGKHQEALNLSELALRLAPNQPQATWNRALALDGLRQSRQAADAFDRAAALSGVAGWGEEARDRARRLLLEPSRGGPVE
jgi:cellulose synthase operon protein C